MPRWLERRTGTGRIASRPRPRYQRADSEDIKDSMSVRPSSDTSSTVVVASTAKRGKGTLASAHSCSSSRRTGYIAERSVAWLEAQAGSGQPFFLQCSFPDPHHPFTPPGKYWDLYDPSDITLPHSFYRPALDSHRQRRRALRPRRAGGEQTAQRAIPGFDRPSAPNCCSACW